MYTVIMRAMGPPLRMASHWGHLCSFRDGFAKQAVKMSLQGAPWALQLSPVTARRGSRMQNHRLRALLAQQGLPWQHRPPCGGARPALILGLLWPAVLQEQETQVQHQQQQQK